MKIFAMILVLGSIMSAGVAFAEPMKAPDYDCTKIKAAVAAGMNKVDTKAGSDQQQPADDSGNASSSKAQ
jgi:hypothetical protein